MSCPSEASTSTSQPVTPQSSPRLVAVADDHVSIFEWKDAVKAHDESYNDCFLPVDVLSELNALVATPPSSDGDTTDEEPERAQTVKPTHKPTLNPRALEFQPSRAPEVARPVIAADPVEEPSWTVSFLSGTCREPTDELGIVYYASRLISSPAFSLSQHPSLLADKFCDRAALSNFYRGNNSTALFAVEVCGTMKRLLGARAAENFRSRLAEVIVITFANTWECEIVAAKQLGGTVALEVTVTGMALGEFMADLHARSLLEGGRLTQALAALLMTKPSMEHLQCMHYIVTHVGKLYWSMSEDVRETFLVMVKKWAEDVKDEMTLVGVKYTPDVKPRWIQEIEERVRKGIQV